MKIKFNEREAIYIQIINYYKSMIASGEMKGGDKLPSVRELSAEIEVNPNTIQKAFAELEREGLTYTQRGRGKFVSSDEEKIKNIKVNMSQEIVCDFLGKMSRLGFNQGEIIEIIKKHK